MVAVGRVDYTTYFLSVGVKGKPKRQVGSVTTDAIGNASVTPSLTLAAIMGEGSVLVMVAASASPLHVNGQTSKD